MEQTESVTFRDMACKGGVLFLSSTGYLAFICTFAKTFFWPVIVLIYHSADKQINAIQNVYFAGWLLSMLLAPVLLLTAAVLLTLFLISKRVSLQQKVVFGLWWLGAVVLWLAAYSSARFFWHD
jgi:hypothetical protein